MDAKCLSAQRISPSRIPLRDPFSQTVFFLIQSYVNRYVPGYLSSSLEWRIVDGVGDIVGSREVFSRFYGFGTIKFYSSVE